MFRYIGVLFFFVTAKVFVGLLYITTSYGLHATPQEANRYLLTIHVPESASDVNYYHSFFSGSIDTADFAIEEQKFLEWMNANNRSPEEFASEDGSRVTQARSYIEGSNERHEVKNGYYFDDYDRDRHDDSGKTIVYDKDEGRAYVAVTTF